MAGGTAKVAPSLSLSEKIMSQRIRGVLAPVLTPFRADFSPDKERFIAHCQWLLSQNCGLAVFGTTSEANSLATDERSTLLRSEERRVGKECRSRWSPDQ